MGDLHRWDILEQYFKTLTLSFLQTEIAGFFSNSWVILFLSPRRDVNPDFWDFRSWFDRTSFKINFPRSVIVNWKQQQWGERKEEKVIRRYQWRGLREEERNNSEVRSKKYQKMEAECSMFAKSWALFWIKLVRKGISRQLGYFRLQPLFRTMRRTNYSNYFKEDKDATWFVFWIIKYEI
jgi:hypothetical protein